jgi:hypothetical protein
MRHEERISYWQPENKEYLIFMQLLPLAIALHIFYGTAVFAGCGFWRDTPFLLGFLE